MPVALYQQGTAAPCFMAAFKSFQQKDASERYYTNSSPQCSWISTKNYTNSGSNALCFVPQHSAVIVDISSTLYHAVKMAPPIIWAFEDSAPAAALFYGGDRAAKTNCCILSLSILSLPPQTDRKNPIFDLLL